ncbi:MAG: PaaI family thioesterase [Planctomycetota bacterium]|nr:PaaI family thioesterase [Planctomycetota bacterium]
MEQENEHAPTLPDMSDIIRKGFLKHNALALVNATLDVCEQGRIVISCPITESISNQHGTVHAGIQCLLADTACGYAALSCADEGMDVVAVEFKINFLAPAHGISLKAIANIVRPGSRLSVCRANIVVIDEASVETPVALMQSTLMLVRTRES